MRLPPSESASVRRRGLRLRREISVQSSDHLSTFTHSGRNTLGRARADVADGINATPAGFERAAIFAGVHAGQLEAFGIERHARTVQPSGIGIGTDEQEQV